MGSADVQRVVSPHVRPAILLEELSYPVLNRHMQEGAP